MKPKGKHWSYRLAEFANRRLSWFPDGVVVVVLVLLIGGIGLLR